MNLINIEQLTLSYGNVIALKNVSMEINRGEVVTIVGPNGSGKTSLLKAIIGAVHPVEGSISVKPGLKIGYVPQGCGFFPHLTAWGNVAFGLFGKYSPEERLFRAKEFLEKMGCLHLAEQSPASLSGGEKQRIAVARAREAQSMCLMRSMRWRACAPIPRSL